MLERTRYTRNPEGHALQVLNMMRFSGLDFSAACKELCKSAVEVMIIIRRDSALKAELREIERAQAAVGMQELRQIADDSGDSALMVRVRESLAERVAGDEYGPRQTLVHEVGDGLAARLDAATRRAQVIDAEAQVVDSIDLPERVEVTLCPPMPASSRGIRPRGSKERRSRRKAKDSGDVEGGLG